MIEVTGLTKSYGGNRGISDVTFTIPEGQIVGFLGPNGAGKTTTMNIITGYLAADAGTAKIAGINVLDNPIEAKKHIGYLPEQPPLYPSMTVREYLDFVYELKGLKSPRKRSDIEKICVMTGITDVYGRVIGHLSKGYKQRIGLAQAMLGEPDVLILDEPSVGLDPRQIVEIRGVIAEIGKSRTVILSTHILTEASAVCERVLVIANGSIVADDKPENLTGNKASRTMAARILGSRSILHPLLLGLDGVHKADPVGETETGSYDFIIEAKPGVDIRQPLFSLLAETGHPLLMLRPQNTSLEEVFLKLTGEPADEKPRKRNKRSVQVESTGVTAPHGMPSDDAEDESATKPAGGSSHDKGAGAAE